MRASPVGVALNDGPKYVASTTLTEPRWANTTALSGDLAAAIGKLKDKSAGELQVHGSGTLIRWLFANDLVDEMTLLIVPWFSVRAAGCSPTQARTWRLDWSNRAPTRKA